MYIYIYLYIYIYIWSRVGAPLPPPGAVALVQLAIPPVPPVDMGDKYSYARRVSKASKSPPRPSVVTCARYSSVIPIEA